MRLSIYSTPSFIVEHAHRLRLDGDAALLLQLHRIEHQLVHVALRHGIRRFNQLSASVDLPWSMCAMMQKLRMRSIGVAI